MTDLTMQKIFDMMSDSARRARADYHLTLGKLIRKLEAIDDDSLPVVFPNGESPDELLSYRGYYADLAFSSRRERATVEDVLALARDALGKTFEGYKGGDFVMGADTPLWAAEWGDNSNVAIMGVVEYPSQVVLIARKLDDD